MPDNRTNPMSFRVANDTLELLRLLAQTTGIPAATMVANITEKVLRDPAFQGEISQIRVAPMGSNGSSESQLEDLIKKLDGKVNMIGKMLAEDRKREPVRRSSGPAKAVTRAPVSRPK